MRSPVPSGIGGTLKGMERETLEGYLAQGLSLEQIGAAVGRHPSTVSYWLKRYGLAATHHDKHAPRGGIDRETLEGFVARRMSLRTMARELDVSLATVSHWMAKFDLAKGAPRPVSPDRICVRVCRRMGRRGSSSRAAATTDACNAGRSGWWSGGGARSSSLSRTLEADACSADTTASRARFTSTTSIRPSSPSHSGSEAARGASIGFARKRRNASCCALIVTRKWRAA